VKLTLDFVRKHRSDWVNEFAKRAADELWACINGGAPKRWDGWSALHDKVIDSTWDSIKRLLDDTECYQTETGVIGGGRIIACLSEEGGENDWLNLEACYECASAALAPSGGAVVPAYPDGGTEYPEVAGE
jgi:hypothetical protein